MELAEKTALWSRLWNGRQDVFGTRREYIDNSGKCVRRYHPLKQGDSYVALTKDWVQRHLAGTEELLIYPILLDNTVNFGVIDFDEQHSFEDALNAKFAAAKKGVTAHIARSTKKGYHLYFFLSSNIPAYYMVSFYDWIFTVCGFKLDIIYNRRLAPETFPRGSSSANTGHGIKPALWGKGLPERNCFVTDTDAPYDDQWEFLAHVDQQGRIQTDEFIKMLESDPEIDVQKNASISIRTGTAVSKRSRGSYRAPLTGDFSKIIDNCRAVANMWNKPGNLITHDERVAILALAKATANGIGIVRKRWDSKEAERQIEYALETDQMPWSCKKMQERGYCRDEFKCHLEPLPPVEKIDGQMKINPEKLDKSLWPEPSCVRFAFEKSMGDVAQIEEELTALAEYSGDDKLMRLANCIRNILKFTKPEHKAHLKDVLNKLKFFKTKAQLTDFIRDIEHEKAIKEAIQYDVKEVGGYKLGLEPGCYVHYVEAKDGLVKPVPFTNFTIDLFKDTCSVGIYENTRTLEGIIHCNGEDYPIKLDVKTLDTNNLFLAKLREATGINLIIKTADIDKLRAAMTLFSTRSLTRIITYEDYGMRYDPDTRQPIKFVGGSWTVTRDDIKQEENSYVDMSGHQCAAHLSLKHMDDQAFRHLATFILNEVLTCHEPSVIYTSIAHSLQSCIHESHVPMKEKPIVFINGLTGSGKSFVGKICAAFHGDQSQIILNATSTAKALEGYGALYKDALLVVDDYKNGYTDTSFKTFLQNAYDSRSRGRLRQNGKQNVAPRVRALCMFTAEDVPTNEASTLARLILLSPKSSAHDSPEDIERGQKIEAAMPHFPAFTARWIKYMLSCTPADFEETFAMVRTTLFTHTKNHQNSNRIVNNLAANYTTWCYLLSFLLAEGIIIQDMHDQLREEHWLNILALLPRMSESCANEKAATVFLTVLQDLLASGKFYIEGATTNQPANNAAKIGYVFRLSAADNFVVNLLPFIAVDAVKGLLNKRGEGISHTKDSIGAQLIQDGVIVDHDPGRTTKRLRYAGARAYVWVCDPEKLGIDLEHFKTSL